MLKGVFGQIKWHYHVAADVYGYTVACKDKKWSLRATVVNPDVFKLEQRPLVFVALHKEGEWRWLIDRLELTGDTVSASLGPPLN